MRIVAVIILLSLCAGCAVSNHGVFPKLVWYWSVDAQLQRAYNRQEKARTIEYNRTNQVVKP